MFEISRNLVAFGSLWPCSRFHITTSPRHGHVLSASFAFPVFSSNGQRRTKSILGSLLFGRHIYREACCCANLTWTCRVAITTFCPKMFLYHLKFSFKRPVSMICVSTSAIYRWVWTELFQSSTLSTHAGASDMSPNMRALRSLVFSPKQTGLEDDSEKKHPAGSFPS